MHCHMGGGRITLLCTNHTGFLLVKNRYIRGHKHGYDYQHNYIAYFDLLLSLSIFSLAFSSSITDLVRL